MDPTCPIRLLLDIMYRLNMVKLYLWGEMSYSKGLQHELLLIFIFIIPHFTFQCLFIHESQKVKEKYSLPLDINMMLIFCS